MEKKTTSFKENINICRCLRNREVGNRNRKRKDFYMLKNLICLSNRKYQVVSCKKSNYTFSYESGRLFSDNYRVCHYGYGLNGGMKKMYELPKGQLYTRNKVEDALIYSCYHDKFNKYDNIPCMVALTCKLRELGERIVQYNLNTGQVIRDICLPQAIKFKYLAWAEPNEMFYVKSVHSVDRSRFHIRAGLSLHVAVVIAIFSAFPLRYIGMFEVDRRVFGAGITNAIITNSLLVVMYITGHVKFFSLENILQTYKTFDCDIEDCCTEPFCEHPCPLQLNIKITECPPVLLDVKCADQNVQIGGYPWHYISTPRGMMGLFEITSLDNHVMVESGELKADFVHPETDSCCFHGDGSGRIMFITKNIVKIYNLVYNDDTGTRSLQSLTSIDIKHDQQKVERIQITSSGRCIRRRQSMDEVSLDDSINIQQLEYEDELDLTWISISETGIPYHVCFYDNLSLQELRNISLENSEVADECYEQQIYVDLDTIVLVTKPRLGQFICTVYRLSGDLNQVDQSATTSKLESSSKSKDNSASNRRRGLRTRTR